MALPRENAQTATIIVASNASTLEYPTNKLSFFHNVLPRHNDLSLGTWKVALQAMTMSNIFLKETEFASETPAICFSTRNGDAIANIFIPRNLITVLEVYDFLRDEFAKIFARPDYDTGDSCCMDIRFEGTTLELGVHNNVRVLIAKKFYDVMGFTTAEDTAVSPYGGSDRILTRDNKEYISYKPTPAMGRGAISLKIKNARKRKLHLKDCTPKRIHVKLNELNPCLSSAMYDKILTTLTLSSLVKNENSYCFEVENQEYHDIRKSDVLTVELTDENHQRLALACGQPTFLKLKFTSRNMEDFPVRISSRDSGGLFPNNQNTSFQVSLPYEKNLEHDQWQVALTSIHYPSKVGFKHVFKDEKEFFLKLTISRRDLLVTLKTFEGSSSEDLINHIVKELNRQMNIEIDIYHLIPEFKLKKNGQLTIKYEAAHGLSMRMEVSPMMAYVLGNSNMGDGMWIWNPGNQPSDVIFPSPVSLERMQPNTLMLYTDLVAPIIVGDKYSPILKLLTQDSSKLDVQCEHLDFIDLARTNIRHMKFDVRDHRGALVKFVDDGFPLLLNLMFRKKQ